MSKAENNNADSERRELLLHMYDQMFNDINRHINIIWQPITVLVGSAALLAAGTKEIISIDIAEALILLLVGWLLALLYDSSYWYNRNLVIIANIERQFLKQSDLHDIHYYFGRHRAKQSMLTHIRIQLYLGFGVGALVLLHHVLSEILKMCPCVSSPPIPFRWEVILPYVAAVGAFVYARHVRSRRIASYEEFLKNSPGIEIDTTGIDYGTGHPIDDEPKAKEEKPDISEDVKKVAEVGILTKIWNKIF